MNKKNSIRVAKGLLVLAASYGIVFAVVSFNKFSDNFPPVFNRKANTYVVLPEKYLYESNKMKVIDPLSIQDALNKAKAGDLVILSDGIYMQDFKTVRSGRAGAPIIIKGSKKAIINGAGAPQIVEIAHNFIKIEGLTLDAFAGSDADDANSYREKLLVVEDGLRGVEIVGVSFKNTDDAPIVCGPRCDTKINLVAAAGSALPAQVSVNNNVEGIQSIEGTLSPGTRTKEVETLDRFLNDQGYLNQNDISSFYNVKIENAVGAFQTAEGIARSGGPGFGIVGPKTLSRINELIFKKYLPAGFPDYGVYPGALLKSSNIRQDAGGKNFEATWETRDSVAVVSRWYKKDFQNRQLLLTIPPADENASNIQYAQYEGEDVLLQLSLIRSLGKTKIVIAFTPPPSRDVEND